MLTQTCKLCHIEKPFPAEFMENYKKQRTCDICRTCRQAKVMEWKRKTKGVPTLGKGWKDTMKGVQNRWKKGDKANRLKKGEQ